MARRAIMTPHDEDEGFIAARVHPVVEGYVILYDAFEAGFESDGGRWTAFCPIHGAMANETSKSRAMKLLQTPENWCDGCSHAKFGPVAMKVVTFDTDRTPEAREREMRFWANRARGSREKQELFERMYGVKPDRFWD